MKELYKTKISCYTHKRYPDTQFRVTGNPAIHLKKDELLIYIGPWQHNKGKNTSKFYLHIKTGSYIVLYNSETRKLV